LVTGVNTLEIAGSGQIPGNNKSLDYTGIVGQGGAIGTSGSNGYVVITYGLTNVKVRGGGSNTQSVKIRGNVKFR